MWVVLGGIAVNSIVESASLRIDTDDLGQVLAHGRSLIETGQFEAAANLYAAGLCGDSMGASDIAHAEMENNLAAALCVLSDTAHHADANQLLEDAAKLLNKALTVRTRRDMPGPWANSRANLALVHLKLFERTADKSHMMAAHLALNATDAALYEAGEYEAIDWVRSIRAHLAAINDRGRQSWD